MKSATAPVPEEKKFIFSFSYSFVHSDSPIIVQAPQGRNQKRIPPSCPGWWGGGHGALPVHHAGVPGHSVSHRLGADGGGVQSHVSAKQKEKRQHPPLCATMTIRNRITNRGLEDESHEDQKSSSA